MKPLTDREKFHGEYKARRGDLYIKYDHGLETHLMTTAPRPCRVNAHPEAQFTGFMSFYDLDDSIVWINTAKVLSMTWTPDDEAAS